jgi:DNA-binding winged helix-turn-helix (wHTH) protein
MISTRADGPSQIRFRSFVLDLRAHRLTRNGREVHIRRQAFELLRILLERAPQALTKAELRDRLWPDTTVADSGLPRVISDLRTIIGDNGQQRPLIRTIHGFGYAFDAKAINGVTPPSATQCMLISRREFALMEGENIIGRDPDVAIPINGPIIQRRHARIIVEQGVARIEALDSTIGTYVDDELVTRSRVLRPGDVVRVGDHELTFCAAAIETATDPRHA